MARIRHLKRAPITEALIDFRVNVPKEFSPALVSDLKEHLRDRYPKVEERRLAESAIQIAPGRLATSTRELGFRGLIFKSADELDIAQFRIDGFTYNRLKPYTSWEQVFPEASRLWELYGEKLAPEYVSRLALRYINHLSIPLPIKDFSQYLTSPPVVPDDLPQAISSFLTRVVLQDPGSDLAANLTQALEPGLDANSVTIILDIDAYKLGEFDPRGPEIVRVLEALHGFKNTIFFGSLTEATLRLYE
ncbi:MAG TPA: TIGR04255 family protein [Dehalococcoidia bacterium]|nr:TIGR04255 family protein [Dehalococcoidia bacterium]